MLRVKTGWVAQCEDGESWTLEGVTATGVYLNPGEAIVHIHLAGTKEGKSGPR